MLKDSFDKILYNSRKQTKLLEQILAKQKPENKFVKFLTGIGPLLSAIVIALVGWHFTNKYNNQQLKIAQIEVIEKFAPLLHDSIVENRMSALATIMSLDDEDLSIRTVSVLDVENKSALLSKMFYAAITTQDYKLMKRILRINRDIPEDSYGWLPLHAAIYMKDVATLKFLLNHGFSPNSVSSKLDRPLDYAAILGDSTMVKILLVQGADPLLKDKQGKTPLHTAVFEARTGVIKELLDSKKIDPNIKNNDGETALISAVGFRLGGSYPSAQIVKLLLDAGANPNVFSKFGNSAIYEATFNDYTESFKLLFDKGAKILPENGGHRSNALFESVAYDRDSIVKYLLEKGFFRTLPVNEKSNLLFGIKKDPNIAQLLLSVGADVNYKSAEGKTVLHSVVEETRYTNMTSEERIKANKEMDPGILQVIRLLVKAGIKLNEPSEYGDLPLKIAARDRSPEIIEELIKSGADINAVSGFESETALMQAALAGRYDNIQLLLGKGAKKEIKNKSGETAYDIAALMLRSYKNDPIIKPPLYGIGSIPAYEDILLLLRP